MRKMLLIAVLSVFVGTAAWAGGKKKKTVVKDAEGNSVEVVEDEEGNVRVNLKSLGFVDDDEEHDENAERTRRKPLKCDGHQDIVLVGVIIEAKDGPAVFATGHCDVVIRNSVLTGTPYAVVATGQSDVVITASELKGKKKALHATGGSDVAISGSQIHGGAKLSGRADLVDNGNNKGL